MQQGQNADAVDNLNTDWKYAIPNYADFIDINATFNGKLMFTRLF